MRLNYRTSIFQVIPEFFPGWLAVVLPQPFFPKFAKDKSYRSWDKG